MKQAIRSISIGAILGAVAVLITVPATGEALEEPVIQKLYVGEGYSDWQVDYVELSGQGRCLMFDHGVGEPPTWSKGVIFGLETSDGSNFTLVAQFNEVDLRSMQRTYERVVQDNIPTLLVGEFAVMAETGHRVLDRNSFDLQVHSVQVFPSDRFARVLTDIDAINVSVLFDLLTDPQIPSLEFSVVDPDSSQKLMEMPALDVVAGDGDAFFYFEQCFKNLNPSDEPDREEPRLGLDDA